MGRRRKKPARLPWGYMSKMAAALEMTPQNISDIFNRRRHVSLPISRKLEEASWKLGVEISQWDFYNNDITPHPLFRGEQFFRSFIRRTRLANGRL